jgi:AmmeMemoRadiSam system protein B
MPNWIRKTAVAGHFYPSDPEALKAMLASFCSEGQKSEIKKSPWGIMAPHAGFIYSGKIAGDVYGRLEMPDKVIILSPNHTGHGPKISVWTEGEWETPLGRVPVEKSLAQSFIGHCNDAKADTDAHQYEHSIEVHLPFLVWLNSKVQILPITLGALTWRICASLGESLAKTVGDFPDEKILVIASSDMSHYIPADEAKKQDTLALVQVEQVSGEGLYRAVVEKEISMCGFIPTAVMLHAAGYQSEIQGEILSYGNSGQRTGDHESVVGYASAWVF